MVSQVLPRNSTSVANFVVAGLRGRGAHDESAGESSLGFGDHTPQARAVFRGADAARHADVIDRGHVNQKASGQRDVAGDARAFFAERFLGDLDDDFFARLQHFGNQLRAAVRFVARVSVLRVLVRRGHRTPAAAASALRALSAAHGPLKARAGLIGNARARWAAARRRCGGSAEPWNFVWVFFGVVSLRRDLHPCCSPCSSP